MSNCLVASEINVNKVNIDVHEDKSICKTYYKRYLLYNNISNTKILHSCIILALLIVTSQWPTVSRLPVKLTEHGTKVTFATTCLHNWIIDVSLPSRHLTSV